MSELPGFRAVRAQTSTCPNTRSMEQHRATELESSLRPWGGCRIITTLAGGHRNTVLLVECRSEFRVAKWTRRGRQAIAWLDDVQEAATQAGFVVPSFVPNDRGELLAGNMTIETWLAGRPATVIDLPRLAPLLREFHALTRGWRQRPGFSSSFDLLEEQQGGDIHPSEMPPDLVEACRAAWRELVGDPLSVVHGDLVAQRSAKRPFELSVFG